MKPAMRNITLAMIGAALLSNGAVFAQDAQSYLPAEAAVREAVARAPDV
ncbi:MAG TPA: metal transporter, partial [Cupriavidus sp.]|nr:metal transporter [Cupriavidus sp.]